MPLSQWRGLFLFWGFFWGITGFGVLNPCSWSGVSQTFFCYTNPPKPTYVGRSNLIVCNFYTEALFCALLRPFALSCALLRTCVCALLRSFALFCVFLRPNAFRTTALGNCRFWPTFDLFLWISVRATEPKLPKNLSAQKVGFPPIPERAPKSVQNRTFCAKSVQKVRYCTLLGALSGIGGNPTFCAD